jgi:hypothetical protein
MVFIRTLFSSTGALIIIYVLVGVFANTAAPHFPQTTGDFAGTAHSFVQYAISVVFWPLGLWHPTFTLGEWTG